MARLRKAAKLWKRPESRRAADSALVLPPDDAFTIDPEIIFSSAAPLEVELGAGKGDFIIARAAEVSARNFLAVELPGVVARMLAVRCGRASLPNLRVVWMDGRTLVNLMFRPRSISAYHIYFPDPWPKERHHKHRLFTPYFAGSLARTLADDGTLHVATDVEAYADDIFAMLEGAGLVRTTEPVPGADRTGFGRRFVASGKRVHAATYRPHPI